MTIISCDECDKMQRRLREVQSRMKYLKRPHSTGLSGLCMCIGCNCSTIGKCKDFKCECCKEEEPAE